MPDTARWGRAIAAGALALSAMVGVAGCQYQTLQDYTPAAGVNTAVDGVMVRNLAIVVTGQGEGVLLGTLVVDRADTLQSVNGVALRQHGEPGAPLQVTSTGEVSVGPGAPVVLLDHAIRISSSDLRPGLTAQVELTFAQAGTVATLVPVMDQQSPEFQDITIPSAEPSPTEG